MAGLPRDSSAGAGICTAVPTVARLRHVKRCTATTVDLQRRQRCRLYSDVTLNGQVLCPLHLGDALWSPDDGRTRDTSEDQTRSLTDLTADYQHRGDLLQEALGHLRAGVPDPTPSSRLVLAAIPTTLIDRIEDALQRPYR